MRCLAIAEEVMSRGVSAILVGSLGGIEWVEKYVSSVGIQVVPPHSFQLRRHSDILIIDSYRIKPTDLFVTGNKWRAIVSISDRDTPDFHPDLIIHPGLSGDWFEGEHTKFKFGASFIPVRKSTTKRIELREGEYRKVVIFGGGTDPFGFAQNICSAISGKSNFREVKVFSSSLDERLMGDQRFELIPFGERLDLELADADLVLTTASTSSLEVIAREIPTGVACAIKNQEDCYNALGMSGVAAQLGERISTGSWKLDVDVLNQLFDSPIYSQQLAIKSKSFIDFEGASRIVDEIFKL
jgi:spore coat polysaccharide biosynthesis predicted glycosyltransferase SpsG